MPTKQLEMFDATKLGLSARLRLRRRRQVQRSIQKTARRLKRGKPETAAEYRAADAGGTLYRTRTFM